MVLDGEDGQLLVAQALHCAIVQVYVADLQSVFEAIRVNGVAVILSGDMNSAGSQVTDRVVATAMPELELESPGTKGTSD